MTYGLRIWRAGAVVFDSRTAQGGVCVGAYEVAPGASTTVDLVSYAGRSVRVISALTSSPFVVISYASGHPVVTLTAPSSHLASAHFVVFVY